MRADEVISFWFSELSPEQWWQKSDKLDVLIRERFWHIHQKAAKGELSSWRDKPNSTLAEIIVLDQFSRNMFRDSAQAFAYDDLALQVAAEGIAKGFDQMLEIDQKAFFYMPYMHSEEMAEHEKAVVLFSQPGLENNLDFELKHKSIIERFGRYPHRNAALGRESTPAEIAFLKEPGSSF